ncbi:hypothetical protein F2Q68_00036458 [Brassica cretica]|uniref:Uncharacterized protein n=1 Tax=Brassica cretica TaxID=69181 RepID=A0A8S9HCC2_BRACR|nr:hypothetical protein F2Q68_00036458 [Brassica cretica]
MEENLAEVMQDMSLGEDKSIIIPDEDEYCAMDRGGRNCRNRTTKRTSNGRELERVGVEVARADRCRVASWLIGDREL